LNEAEIDMMAEYGVAIAHCPPTNSILGNCAYLPYMLHKGVKVGLGTDFPTHNLFNVMLSVSQQHAIMPRPMRGLLPWTPYELATLGSARALRWEDQIGTLEVGKRADVVTIDLTCNTSLFPLNVGTLMLFLSVNGPGTEVTDALVDGHFLRRDGKFTFLDEAEIMGRAQYWCEVHGRLHAGAGRRSAHVRARSRRISAAVTPPGNNNKDEMRSRPCLL